MTAVQTAAQSAQQPDHRRRQSPPESERLAAENRLGRRLVAPAMIVMLIVTAFPILRALYLSLFSYTLTAPDDREFIGLGNYLTALSDSLLWQTIGVTVFYMVVTVGFELVIGFAFALVMHRVIFARGLIRTSILIPYGIITVVSGFAWQFAFTDTNGFINSWFDWVPGITESDPAAGVTGFNWFGQTPSAIFAIMISEIWKTTPFMSLLLLAGLAQVSDDMVEAAKVDGASWWQRMWRVVIPNMRAAIMVAVLFRALDAYRIFDNIYVMTSGALNTESISFLVYRQTIEQFQIGMGSALSVILFLSVLLIAFGIVKLFRVDLAQARGEG